jgi:transposase-like protein
MCEGYSIRQLSQQGGLSAWKLRQVIHYWLDRPPDIPRDLSGHRCVVVDGTFVYGRRVGAAVFIDGITHDVIAGIYGLQEGERAMIDVCRNLKQRGLDPFSATIDGNPHLQTMLRTVWPQVIIQRCLVHIQFQGQRWCRAHPKTPEGRELRELFTQVTRVSTRPEQDRFLRQLNEWERRYGPQVEHASPRAWVARDLRAARSMLTKALPNMFHYLEYPGIPTTTNAAEGYFGRLKHRYAQHRGLAPDRRQAYFQWHFHLCR